MSEYRQYYRIQTAEMTRWTPETDLDGVSISKVDLEAGSPKEGDMIARNPKDHTDRWLVSAAYFHENYEPAR